MANTRVSYNPEITQTDHGRRIYACWKRTIRTSDHAPEFDRYPDFFDWAAESGYEIGLKLARYDESQPYSPDNCFWAPTTPYTYRDTDREKEWDEVVNRIRQHYGMEPIHSSEG